MLVTAGKAAEEVGRGQGRGQGCGQGKGCEVSTSSRRWCEAG